MEKGLIKRYLSNTLIILLMILFVLSPLKKVNADEKNNNNNSEVTQTVKENDKQDYSTLYIALIVSLASLGLVFLNKKQTK